MLASEKLALAAHMHVLLRRKTGRVTDTEWLACNRDYALEILRFARASAKEGGHVDIAAMADKLERALALNPTQPAALKSPAPLASSSADTLRYVAGLR